MLISGKVALKPISNKKRPKPKARKIKRRVRK